MNRFSTDVLGCTPLRGWPKKDLGEKEYKSYILSHYTFLKRPVIRVGNEVFVGYKKDTIAAAEMALKS